jgi:hypothetical protein
MSSHLISIPLCHIFNLSIRKLNFPSIFKLAKVIPVFKNNGSRNIYILFGNLPLYNGGNHYERGRFGALKSDSTHHFFRNACTKSGSLRFSQFSACWLILSVYILMSFDFPFVRYLVQAFLKKWWVESDFKAPNLPLSIRLKDCDCHYNTIYNNTGTNW